MSYMHYVVDTANTKIYVLRRGYIAIEKRAVNPVCPNRAGNL